MKSDQTFRRALDLIQRGVPYDVYLYDDVFPPKIKEVYAIVSATNNSIYYNDKEYTLNNFATVDENNKIVLSATINANKLLKVLVNNLYM